MMVTLQWWIIRQDLRPLRRQDYLLCLAVEQKATYSDVRDANGAKVTLGRISLSSKMQVHAYRLAASKTVSMVLIVEVLY